MPYMVVEAKTIRIKAMDLLARREHSVKELLRKLCERYEETELIADVVRQLSEDNLVSDSRFAEMYIRSRIGRQFGPVKIKNDLRERGVSEDKIRFALNEANQNWLQLIQELSEKKYGKTLPSEAKETAKRMRFFQSRGFDTDCIRSIFQ
jgi:regulatory protein